MKKIISISVIILSIIISTFSTSFVSAADSRVIPACSGDRSIAIGWQAYYANYGFSLSDMLNDPDSTFIIISIDDPYSISGAEYSELWWADEGRIHLNNTAQSATYVRMPNVNLHDQHLVHWVLTTDPTSNNYTSYGSWGSQGNLNPFGSSDTSNAFGGSYGPSAGYSDKYPACIYQVQNVDFETGYYEPDTPYVDTTPESSMEMDMRSDFSITGQYDNFTATYLGTEMCEFGINNNCNPPDMPSPLALRWRLINDDLTVDPFTYGDMNDANTVCTVVTAYNDPFTSDSCIELFPENSSKWVKNGHYTLYLQPFIQQSVLDTLPQYNITMRYTGQAFNTGLANYTNDTSNNTISEDGTFTTPPTVSPYPDCGTLYPIAWDSFDNFLPAIGCQISNGLSVLFIPTSDSLNAIFTSTTFETHGLTAVITSPLSLINDLTTSGCTAMSLPLPFVNQNLTLPCMGTIYQDNFGDIFTLYQTITTGFICYWIVVKFLNKVKGFKDPEEDKIEVLDL